MSKLKTYKFGKLYEMSSGISSKPEQAGHGSPFVSFKTVFNNYFLPDSLDEYMDVSENDKITYSIKKGDVFLTRTSESLNELAMSCVADKDYPEATYSGFLKRLRPTQNDVTYDRFMAFYLRSELFRKTMTNNAIMTLRASFNEQIFSYLDLILPDYIEQKKTGDFLYSLSEKIKLNNKINSELESIAKTLYEYWFVQFDFPDADGKPYKTTGGKMVWNEEFKREIPEGWEVKRVENVLTKETSLKKIPSSEYLDKGSVPIIDQSTTFIAGFTNDTNFKIDCETPRIVFGDHTRILKLINFDFARGADGTQVLLSNNKRNPQHLFYYSLLKIDLSNYGYARHFKFLKDSKIILPEEIIAHKFERIVSDFYKKIKSNIFQNQELASLRDWLLPMLMNGQVSAGEVSKDYDVKEDVLGMVAEANNNNTFTEIMNQLNFDYEIAAVASLTFQKFKHNYGKKYMHKMFSNIELLNTLPVFKELSFEEKGWGMFSPQIKKAIDDQKFIQFEEINDTQKVIQLNYKYLKEVSTWMKQEENKEFITQVNNMLTIYENPIINKKMDNIELLNTVLECMKVLKTDDFKSIYSKMKNWPMEEEGYATKADKFNTTATQHMILFIKEIKN